VINESSNLVATWTLELAGPEGRWIANNLDRGDRRPKIAPATNRRVKGFVADTGDDAAVKTAVAQARGEFGRVDILVNSAAAVGGQGKPPALAEITYESFFADVNVKVMGYLRTIREVAPHMAARAVGASSTFPVSPRSTPAPRSARYAMLASPR
jgi:NAD(P)-dependent dehydrogenase (short-subunit alcohol dehydrogenase family)